jgi:hypothetical protein
MANPLPTDKSATALRNWGVKGILMADNGTPAPAKPS